MPRIVWNEPERSGHAVEATTDQCHSRSSGSCTTKPYSHEIRVPCSVSTTCVGTSSTWIACATSWAESVRLMIIPLKMTGSRGVPDPVPHKQGLFAFVEESA